MTRDHGKSEFPLAVAAFHETTPTGRTHAFDLAPRGDRACYFVLDDAGWFPWEHSAGDPRPREHVECVSAYGDFGHVNCRCVIVEDARTAIVEHEDAITKPPEWSAAPPWGFDVDRYRKPMELRVARHGPFGGLTRYGRPYAGKATVFGPPAPLSKRARRRARGKARHALTR